MAKTKKTSDGFIYISGKRHHTKDYPYRIAVKVGSTNCNELEIQHQYIHTNPNTNVSEWMPSHGVVITKKDLVKILKSI